jgi:hypothetical protein
MEKDLIFYRKGHTPPDVDLDKKELVPIDDNYFALIQALYNLTNEIRRSNNKRK